MIERINPKDLPGFPGLSNVVRAGRSVYVAGQVAVDGEGNLQGDDAEAQLRQIYRNLETALAATGATLADLVKTTTFITKRDDFASVSRVRSEMYGDRGPANSTVIVAGLARPEWLVEIEGIAHLESDGE